MELLLNLLLSGLASLLFWVTVSAVIGLNKDIKSGREWIRKNVKLF